jgi:hypothetical protein
MNDEPQESEDMVLVPKAELERWRAEVQELGADLRKTHESYRAWINSCLDMQIVIANHLKTVAERILQRRRLPKQAGELLGLAGVMKAGAEKLRRGGDE